MGDNHDDREFHNEYNESVECDVFHYIQHTSHSINQPNQPSKEGYTFGVNTSRFLWWTEMSRRMGWLNPDPGYSCRLLHSSLANFNTLECFYSVFLQIHSLRRFPSSHTRNISILEFASLFPSNNNCGIYACMDLVFNLFSSFPTFASKVTFRFEADHA